jgi:hypothetical protein
MAAASRPESPPKKRNASTEHHDAGASLHPTLVTLARLLGRQAAREAVSISEAARAAESAEAHL